MKRILLSILLVVALISSSMCCVNAESMREIWDAYFTDGRTVYVPVDIKVNDTYRVHDYAGTPLEFTATLDMTEVKAAVGALSASLDATEKLKKATGTITIVAEWSGVNAPDASALEINDLAGFTFVDGVGANFFEEPVNRVLDGNKLTATISVKDNVTLQALADLPREIVLTQSGFTLADDGVIKGTLTLDIKVENNAEYTVPFNVATNEVTVSVKSSTGNGTASISKFYDLKYETNGGAAIADESYVSGKTVQLTKVPEKEGHTFEGWYADAELTEKVTSVTMNSDVTVYAAWKAIEGDEPVVVHPVPEMLNGEDHFAYLAGYPDGTIRPDSNITRAEVATIFFRLLKDEVREQYLSTENVFVDVNEGEWYNTAISTMAKAGVVNGRSADTFAPDEYITRAEFTTICARFDEANESGENMFTDIDDHWAVDYILEAIAYGWIDGYEDSSFRPENNITRAEAATLINRVLNRVPENADALLDAMKVWPDNDSELAWYYLAVQEATNSHTFELVNDLNEKWVELTENRDWTVYEK